MADEPNAGLLQQIVSHPEFANLLQTISTQQLVFEPKAMEAGKPPVMNGPLPAPHAVVGNPTVQGKDQSRVVSARYPGDR